MKVRNLGIGGVEIQLPHRSIFVDAFNSVMPPPELTPGDLVLFTHDDADHFHPGKLSQAITPENIIVAPPSIVLPLWETQRVSPGQLKILYPKEYHNPEYLQLDDLAIKVFNTEHFVGWHNIHVSFLIEQGNSRVYITGDSSYRRENLEELKGVDCLIFSLLKEEIVKETMDRKFGVYHHICQLQEVMESLQPKKLMVNHLLDCPWAISPWVMKKEIADLKMENIHIATDNQQWVSL